MPPVDTLSNVNCPSIITYVLGRVIVYVNLASFILKSGDAQTVYQHVCYTQDPEPLHCRQLQRHLPLAMSTDELQYTSSLFDRQRPLRQETPTQFQHLTTRGAATSLPASQDIY